MTRALLERAFKLANRRLRSRQRREAEVGETWISAADEADALRIRDELADRYDYIQIAYWDPPDGAARHWSVILMYPIAASSHDSPITHGDD